VKSRLLQEFTQFYEQYRCPNSPENPRRVFGLAKKLYQRYSRRIGAWEFMSVVFATLDSLFERFDETKYKEGQLSLPDHFMNMFGNRLKINLQRAANPRTDSGQPADRSMFNAGLFKSNRVEAQPEEPSLEDQWAREAVQRAVGRLAPGEHDVIHQRYWNDYSDREIGQLLKLDHKTVRQRHDKGIKKLKGDDELLQIVKNSPLSCICTSRD
jgi:RNA polymerase sigma factor (sigma-70 family)